jgi:hypothetical protein
MNTLSEKSNLDKKEFEELREILRDRAKEYTERQQQKMKAEQLDLSDYPNLPPAPPKKQE